MKFVIANNFFEVDLPYIFQFLPRLDSHITTVPSAKRMILQFTLISKTLLIYIEKSKGSRVVPCGTANRVDLGEIRTPFLFHDNF